MLRRLLIVAVLFWAMFQAAAFRGLNVGEGSASAMVSFGFIVLAATTLGELAHRIHLPHITGYLLAGVAWGPHFLGLLSGDVVGLLKLFDVLAIALIAMEAGAQLDLRKLLAGWRPVGMLTGMLVVVSLAGGLLFAVATSGIVPATALPMLEDATPSLVVSVGLLLGVMVLATSPPVTLAVVAETRARGRFTDTVLSSVIINNIQVVVLFALAVALAQGLLGAGEGAGAGAVVAELTWSIVLGAVAATVVAASFRYLGGDALLAVVGLGFGVTWVANELGANPLLTFLVAGGVVSNATRAGPAFRGAARKLSGPVYVLFFTLIGADLHIDALETMAPFAIALVAMRLGGFLLATRLAHRLVPLPDTVQRLGHLGLAPQAGIALTVAIGVGHTFSGWGTAFETLGLAAIALNEMVGPVLLKVALGRSGESAEAREEAGDDALEDVTAEITGSLSTAAPVDTLNEDETAELMIEDARALLAAHDSWGPPPDTGHAQLDALARGLRHSLEQLFEEVQRGALASRRASARHFVETMGKVLEEGRGRMTAAAAAATDPVEREARVRDELRLLAARWRALVLERAETLDFQRDLHALEQLVRHIDRTADHLPDVVTMSIGDAWLERRDGEAVGDHIRRVGLRLRRGLARATGGRKLLRTIQVRTMARFHLSGWTPRLMRDVAERLAASEELLLRDAGTLFATLTGGLERQLAGRHPWEPSVAWDQVVRACRLTADVTERRADELENALHWSISRTWRGLVADLSATNAATASRKQTGKVFQRRERALTRLAARLRDAPDQARARAGMVAAGLELLELDCRLRPDVQHTQASIAGQVHEQLTVHLVGVAAAVTELAAQLGDRTDASPGDRRTTVEQATAHLADVVEEALVGIDRYRVAVLAQGPLAGLRRSVSAASIRLSEHLPAAGASAGEVLDLPMRVGVRGFLELEGGRALDTLADEVEALVDSGFRAVQGIERSLQFHREQASAQPGPAPRGAGHARPEDELLRALQHFGPVLADLVARSSTLERRARSTIHGAVLGNLDRLRRLAEAADAAELGATLDAAAAESRPAVRGRREAVAGRLGNAWRRIEATIGPERVAAGGGMLGIRPSEPRDLGPEAFAPPRPGGPVPAAYERLFSDRTLDAADLLTGREADVARVRSALLGDVVGRRRAVAVVAIGGMSKRAAMEALTRGIGDEVELVNHRFVAPVEDRAALRPLAEAARRGVEGGRRTVIVVDGLNWLFGIRAGGFDVLREFVALVITTSQHVGWLVGAQRPVWAYANRVVPLVDAFPERLELGKLDVDGLREAVLRRHGMSGFRLWFRRPDASLRWWFEEVLRPKRSEQAMYADQYFRALHAASDGVLADALRLWLASVADVDEARELVGIGAPARPPVDPIRRLDPDELITLRQVARQGRVTVGDLSAQLRQDPDVSSAHLARLAHWGLLETDTVDTYRFHPDLAGPAYRVLRERGLVG